MERAGFRRPLSAGLLRGCGFVQHPPELSLLSFGEWRRTGGLGLEQRSQKDSVILLGTVLTKVTAVRTAGYLLGLKDLRLALTTPLA